MTLTDTQWAGFSIIVLGFFLLLSAIVRRYVPGFAALYIPTSVIAGFLILLLGPQALGLWVGNNGLIPGEVLAVWATLPGLLINVVFAALMLGKRLPSVAHFWRAAAPHVIFGSALSFGQFALGALAVFFILTPFFGVPDVAGSLIELSFAGGHGIAAGMQPLFEDAGAAELVDVSLGLSTIAMVTGIITGSLLVGYAAKSTRIPLARVTVPDKTESHDLGGSGVDTSEQDAPLTNRGMGPVTVAVMCVALAILIAIVLLEGIRALAQSFGSDAFDSFPLFPLTVIGGFVVQWIATKVGKSDLIEKRSVNGISAISLDVVIATAIGTMVLSTLSANLPVLIGLSVVGVGWSVFALFVFGPRIHGRDWFEHSIADFGHSQGNVATGFVLVGMADPRDRTTAKTAFGYKQLGYEPFLGGGFITAFSVPFIVAWGSLIFGLVSAVIAALLLTWGVLRARGADLGAAS